LTSVKSSWVALDRIVSKEALSDEAIRRQLEQNARPLRSHTARMGDEDLLAKLHGLGVDADREKLAKLCEGVLSAEEVVSERLRLHAWDTDWAWICLVALWERWWRHTGNTGSGFVVLLQEDAEFVDRLLLVRSQVFDHGHVGAGPVDPGVVIAVGRGHQEMVVGDLDVIPYLLPRDAGRHQADRGRVAVVELKVLEHASPSGGLLAQSWGTQWDR
jgi:hypothetical protein